MKTWEVKLLAGNNGIVQTTVQADDFDRMPEGIAFYKRPRSEEPDVAFFPYDKLLSVKDVTP